MLDNQGCILKTNHIKFTTMKMNVPIKQVSL